MLQVGEGWVLDRLALEEMAVSCSVDSCCERGALRECACICHLSGD